MIENQVICAIGLLLLATCWYSFIIWIMGKRIDDLHALVKVVEEREDRRGRD